MPRSCRYGSGKITAHLPCRANTACLIVQRQAQCIDLPAATDGVEFDKYHSGRLRTVSHWRASDFFPGTWRVETACGPAMVRYDRSRHPSEDSPERGGGAIVR